MCKGTLLTQKYLHGEKLTKAELIFFNQTVKQYRERLSSISWFMRLLNEDITRKANKEDNCTGRFYSLPSMAYVDLNPIRAKIAKRSEGSNHTSVKKCLENAAIGKQPKSLYPTSNFLN